ncbi:response regulator [Leptospira levettii]|uniref:histidine kinase n=2 Tax=Leptospira levettii TaxID=2023178 RepID=A0ABY2MRG4_9LEPT|nr:histidine kinase [Leptospira sp. mixed culture ATI2-C-A1]TGL73390.1 response regulator [Leptospira levettii]TGM29321.1 response regulator [Leptospira levettii]
MLDASWMPKRRLFPYLLTNFSLFIFVSIAFAFYTASERNIDAAEENRYKSLQIANELRQSSDQLTNLVRLYAIQKKQKYKEYFQRILEIRNGEKPRPKGYDYAYWDLVIADELPPPPEEGEQISIYDAMKQADFEESDYALLSLSKEKSDQLTKIEFESMSLIEEELKTGRSNPKAIRILFDDHYLKCKAEIMKPINDLYVQLDERTSQAILDAKEKVFFLRTVLILSGIIFGITLYLTHRSLVSIMGGSVDEVFRRISLLGEGKFTGEIQTTNNKNSILNSLNITQKRLQELYEEKEMASHAKSEFLASMSHEIRTPLNGVIGITQILFKTNLDAEQKNYLKTIVDAGKALLNILNDILDFSKIDAGKLKIENIPFHLPNLIKEIFDLFVIESQAKQLEFSYQIDPKVPEMIISDPSRIRQILFNLIGNAIKFTETGYVILHVEIKDQMILFEIKDSGIGISSEKLSSLFQKFSQLDASTSRKYGGTGLGLAISERLVKLLDGKIGVKSVEGVGSTFWCMIPLSTPKETVTNPILNREDTEDKFTVQNISENFSNQSFLVVEDNVLNQKVIGGLLKKQNINYDLAENGKIAVEMCQKKHYDLILMDCEMPIMDGFEATTKIREMEKNKEQKSVIIAVTAHVLNEHKQRCSEVGMDGFISKPFYIDDLLQTYKKVLNNKRVK